MIRTTHVFIRLVALLLALVMAAPSTAAEGKEFRLEAVKVSAQKREEDVQEVPMALSVLSDMALEESRITGLAEIDKISPNVFISSPSSANLYSFVGIRGRMNNSSDLDPTVTVLVDGVPYDDFYSMGNNLLYDVERVEVLRGPQSTMYGLNSIAGVINIITRQPTDTFRAKAYGEGGYGDKWDGSYTIGGSIGGPIVEEKLSGSLAFMSRTNGAYILNQANDHRYNDDRNIGLKGNFSWTPTGSWDISGGLNYSKAAGNYGFIYLPYDGAAATKAGQADAKWQTNIDEEGDSHVETLAPHLKVNYKLDDMEITSITAYRRTQHEFLMDMDLTPMPIMWGGAQSEFQTLSQELRVQSLNDESSPLEWMAGYYFYTFNRDQFYDGVRMVAPGVHAPMVFNDAKLRGTSNAVFAQGTYRFMNNALGLTLGLRQEFTYRKATEENGIFGEAAKSDSQFLPKVAVDYRITPEHMVYASIGQGWRSGGVNHLAAAGNPVKYKKETCWSYEVGAKTRWLDDKLLFNVATFYTDYTDYQDVVRTGLAALYHSNVPEVKMIGFETDLQARITQALSLTAGFGYVKAWYVDFPDAAAGDFNGNTVISVPDYDYNLALKYTFLDNFYVRPEVQGVGTIYWDRGNTKKQTPYATLNMRVGYAKDNYEIYAFGENLTNEYAFSYTVDYYRDGNLYGTAIIPLRMGLGASMEF